MSYNPYAPPAYGPPPLGPFAPGYPGAYPGQGESVWRDGPWAMTFPHGAHFPDRCAVCNAPALGKRITKTLYWHAPAYYLALFGGVLIYAIVAMVVRKSATVSYGLCPKHDTRRKIGMLVGIGGFIGFFILMIVGAGQASPEIMLTSLALMLITPIVGAILARTISPARIDDRGTWIKVGAPFLESLPSVPSATPYFQGAPGAPMLGQASWPAPGAYVSSAEEQAKWGPR